MRERLWDIAPGPNDAAFARPTRAAIPAAGPAAAAASTSCEQTGAAAAAASTSAAVVVAFDAATAAGAISGARAGSASPSPIRWAAHPRWGKWLLTICELTSCELTSCELANCEQTNCRRPLRIGSGGRCRLILGPD